MNFVEADKYISRIESENADAIGRLSFLGLNYWPVFRLNFGFKNLPSSKSKRTNQLPYFSALKNLWKACRLPKQSQLLICSSASFNLATHDSKIFSRAKELQKSLKSSAVVVESLIRAEELSDYCEERLQPRVDLTDNWITHLAQRTCLLFFPIALLWYLKDRSSLKQIGVSLKRFLMDFSLFYASYLFYRALYFCLQPRAALFLIAPYGREAQVAALRASGCFVAEYQHSAIYSEHQGYNFHSKLKPFKKKFPISQRIYLYGDFWKAVLQERGFYDEAELSVVGNINMFSQDLVSDPQGRRRVLVCSQPAESERFIALIANYLTRSPHKNEHVFWIKPHPRESEFSVLEWKSLAEKFPDSVILQDLDTYRLMESCDLHLTCQSGTVYEAIYFKKPTFVIGCEFGIRNSKTWPRSYVREIDDQFVDRFEQEMKVNLESLRTEMWKPFKMDEFVKKVENG